MLASCTVPSNEPFLTSAVHFLDCSARHLGSLGYLGVALPSGAAVNLIMAGLTIAIALFGIRLMFNSRVEAAAPVELAVRIGFVLLLAFSWPAMRILVFDVTFEGPAQFSYAMMGTDTATGDLAFLPQLQSFDDSIQALTAWGTGREELNAVRAADGRPAAQAFQSVAVSDQLALGAARVTYLASAVFVAGGFRLAAGILIALLPLLAVFLLFRSSEGVVLGWLRAMLALLLSSVAGSILLALETGFGLPWIGQRIAERSQSLAAPSAPTELLVMSVTASLMVALTTFIIFRLCFAHFPRVATQSMPKTEHVSNVFDEQVGAAIRTRESTNFSTREVTLAGSVARLVGRETRVGPQLLNQVSTESTRSTRPSTVRLNVSPRHVQRQSRADRLRSGMR